MQNKLFSMSVNDLLLHKFLLHVRVAAIQWQQAVLFPFASGENEMPLA